MQLLNFIKAYHLLIYEKSILNMRSLKIKDKL